MGLVCTCEALMQVRECGYVAHLQRVGREVELCVLGADVGVQELLRYDTPALDQPHRSWLC